MPVRTEYDLAAEHAALCELYDAAEHRLGQSPQVLTAPAPDASAWSVGHHLAHVAHVNGDIFGWLLQVAFGRARGSEAEAERHPLALRLLASGNFGRGRAESPERYVPPEELSLEELRASWRTSRDRLDALVSHLEALDASPAHRNHFLLGSLTVDLWLRLAHVHMAHHLAIVREIEAAQEAA